MEIMAFFVSGGNHGAFGPLKSWRFLRVEIMALLRISIKRGVFGVGWRRVDGER